jgi:hypothetical protein
MILWIRVSHQLFANSLNPVSLNSAVRIATGYGLDDREVGVRVPVGQFFISPYHPDLLCGPLSLPNAYGEVNLPEVKGTGT